jgi:hypothetical protein
VATIKPPAAPEPTYPFNSDTEPGFQAPPAPDNNIDWEARFRQAHGSLPTKGSAMDRWKMDQLKAGITNVGNRDYRNYVRSRPRKTAAISSWFSK